MAALTSAPTGGSIAPMQAPAPHRLENLIGEEEIGRRVDALVLDISRACRSDNLVMIGILRGSFMFLADLVRDLYRHELHPRIDFITLESYGSGTVSSGTVRLARDVSVDLRGADVLVVDDILDTGRTLSFARGHLEALGARSVRTCALLDKPSRRAVPFTADFVGFTVEDHFVVGYGLDYDNRYRELPYIARVVFA
jgi:hypoxanthine phosphoribosyltransferase